MSAQASPAAAAADLVLKSVALDPAIGPNGTSVQITATIKNEGDQPAAASTARIRINQSPDTVGPTDDVLCSSLATPPLNPGSAVDVSCTVTLQQRPTGANYIWAIADVNKTSGQEVTGNDRAAALFVVSDAGPDLLIQDIDVSPASIRNGQVVGITVTVANDGIDPAPATTTRIRVNQDPADVNPTDLQVCNLSTPAIESGGSVQVTCTPIISGLPAGTNYVWAIADVNKVAGQNDTTNDRAAAPLEIAEEASDLVIDKVAVTPASGPNGTQVLIVVTIRNQGTAAALASTTRLRINEDPDTVAPGDMQVCGALQTPPIGAGDTAQVKCSPKLTDRPPGTNYIWALADTGNTAGQSNRNNDNGKAAFIVDPTPMPDLVVRGVSVSPTSVTSGKSITITATVANDGNANAASSKTRFLIGQSAEAVADGDTVLCDQISTSALAPGASVQVKCSAPVTDRPAGIHYVWAVADVTSTSGQTNHDNDALSAALRVLPPDGPDLTVTRLVVRPVIARNGESIVVRATVANIGNKPAAASLTSVRINQDAAAVDNADAVLCAAIATPALAPQETTRVRCVATIAGRPVGPNWLWATADITWTSGQVNAANDRASTPLTVANPDCTTGDDPAPAPALAWPVEQPRVIQDYASYGSVRLAYHSGIDLVTHLPIAPEQTPVRATAEGEVVARYRRCPSPADALVNPPSGRCAGGWGNYVIVRHAGGIVSAYAHLGKVSARRGCVAQGQRLGLAGSSGAPELPVHVHFDVLDQVPDPVGRRSLGAEYYKTYYPLIGHWPENETGAIRAHLDPRDLMTRSRIRITRNTSASRAIVTGGTTAFLAQDQQYISYGELVPGFFCIDLPSSTIPQDGPPYADDVRYGWVGASDVEVLETGLEPGAVRVDGYEVYTQQGVGPGAVAIRSQPSTTAVEISKAWADQQFAPFGSAVTDATGKQWQPVDVPGAGPGQRRKGWLPLALLGAAQE